MTESQAEANVPAQEPKANDAADNSSEPDWKAEARKWESRAKENAEARKRLDQIEEKNKTELQRANERAEQAEREREAEKVASLRWRIAAKHGISDEDAEMFLTASDEDSLTRQAQRLSDRVKAQRHPDPNQGANGGGSATTADQFAAWSSNL